MKMNYHAIRFFVLTCIVIHCVYAGDDNRAYAQTMLAHDDQLLLKAIFIPDNKPDAKKILLGLIEQEQDYIFLAQFLLNDKTIAQALIDADARGVTVMIILDEGCLNHKNEKASYLIDHGIEIFFYKKYFSLMHNKFYIFGKNLNDKPLLFTGSANASFSGFKKNQENIIITDSSTLVEQYAQKFTTLLHEILCDKHGYSLKKQTI